MLDEIMLPEKARIAFRLDDGNGFVFITFDGSRVVIGRGETCGIRFTDCRVSDRHARVMWDENKGWMIQDLRSTNGTFVDDSKITTEPQPLHLGEIVRLGALISFTVVPYSDVPPQFRKQTTESSNA